MSSRGDRESFGFSLRLQADEADSGKECCGGASRVDPCAYHMGPGFMKAYYEELTERVEILEVVLPTKEKSELNCTCNRRKGSKR